MNIPCGRTLWLVGGSSYSKTFLYLEVDMDIACGGKLLYTKVYVEIACGNTGS